MSGPGFLRGGSGRPGFMPGGQMDRWVIICNRSRGGKRVLRARWCRRFCCRLRGLTFRQSLGPDEGLLLVESRPSRLGTAIHMLGMCMDLGVVWLDSERRAVDRQHARRGRLYLPRRPAQYVLEGPLSLLESVSVGDEMEFVDAALD